MFRRFNKKRYKEQLPDGDERKRFIDYPAEGMLAEIFHYVKDVFSDTCYLKASEEMRNNQKSRYSEKIEHLEHELKREQNYSWGKENDLHMARVNLKNAMAINEFLIDCLKEKYKKGLFIVSNGIISDSNMPVVCIKNGEEIAKNASEVTISWSRNDFPHIEISHDHNDVAQED